MYSGSVAIESAIIGRELLQQSRDQKRQKILQWIWKGDYLRTHRRLCEIRLVNTGQWFIEHDIFQDWATGAKSQTLICFGIRTLSFPKAY